MPRVAFGEIDLRLMIESGDGCYRARDPERWVIATRHRGQRWLVIVEPDLDTHTVVVITAFGVD